MEPQDRLPNLTLVLDGSPSLLVLYDPTTKVLILILLDPQSGRFALSYLLPGFDVNHDAFMMGALRKEVTRNLGRLQPAMMEDLRCTIDQTLGLDTESWNEVCIRKAMDKIFFTSISHVLVGSSLYRNEEYIRCSIRFATWWGIAVVLVGQYFSWMIKPFIGFLGALPVYYSKRKALKLLVPVVRDRLSNIKRKRADPSFDYKEPVDMLTWITQAMLDDAETMNHPAEFLAQRVLFLVSHARILYWSFSARLSRHFFITMKADILIY